MHDVRDDQRRFYRAHVQAVYAFFTYSVDRTTAEDLTAATFERAIRAWQSFDQAKGSERTWVTTIARNTLTDHFRRESFRRSASLDAHPELLNAVAATDDPLARELDLAGLISWLETLAPREREVLALRYGADLSALQVAEHLGLSEGNVHQIASRALRRLRASPPSGTESDQSAEPEAP